MQKENFEKINLLNKEINELKINNKNILDKYSENNSENKNKKINKNKIKNNKNKLIKKLNIILFILILINIFQFILIKNNIFKYIFLLTVPTFLIFYAFSIKKEKNKIKNREKIEKNNFNEINLQLINLENEKKLIENNQKSNN